jgi:hypothetical protein
VVIRWEAFLDQYRNAASKAHGRKASGPRSLSHDWVSRRAYDRAYHGSRRPVQERHQYWSRALARGRQPEVFDDLPLLESMVR